MSELHEIRYSKKFFEHDVPTVVESLARVAAALEQSNVIAQARASGEPAIVEQVYVVVHRRSGDIDVCATPEAAQACMLEYENLGTPERFAISQWDHVDGQEWAVGPFTVTLATVQL